MNQALTRLDEANRVERTLGNSDRGEASVGYVSIGFRLSLSG